MNASVSEHLASIHKFGEILQVTVLARTPVAAMCELDIRILFFFRSLTSLTGVLAVCIFSLDAEW